MGYSRYAIEMLLVGDREALHNARLQKIVSSRKIREFGSAARIRQIYRYSGAVPVPVRPWYRYRSSSAVLRYDSEQFLLQIRAKI